MAAIVVATVGASNANSYVTLAEATTYFDERLNVSAWTSAASDDLRNRALIEATRRIDQEEFEGTPTKALNGTAGGDPTQALKWPREGADNGVGGEYDDDVIPICVKHATFELALALLAAGASDLLADSGLEAFENVKVGPLDVTPRHSRAAGALPANVRRLLAAVITTSPGSIRLLRT